MRQKLVAAPGVWSDVGATLCRGATNHDPSLGEIVALWNWGGKISTSN